MCIRTGSIHCLIRNLKIYWQIYKYMEFFKSDCFILEEKHNWNEIIHWSVSLLPSTSQPSLPFHYAEHSHHTMFLVSIHKWLGKLSLHYKKLIFEHHLDTFNKMIKEKVLCNIHVFYNAYWLSSWCFLNMTVEADVGWALEFAARLSLL